MAQLFTVFMFVVYFAGILTAAMYLSSNFDCTIHSEPKQLGEEVECLQWTKTPVDK